MIMKTISIKKILILLGSLSLHSLKAINEHELKFVKKFVKPTSLVFDVGAHTGAKTDLYLALNAQVICIEPQPACIQVLRQKYAHNSQVHIIAAGLSDMIGNMELYLCSQAPTISTFSKEWQHGRFEGYAWDKVVTVPVTTLDILIDTYGVPHFCKIDVEGFEMNVLKSNDWNRFSPNVILLEDVSYQLEDLYKNPCHVFLKEKGYSATSKTCKTVFYRKNKA